MEEIKKFWTDRYQINWHEADYNGNATLTTLCNFLQETAWRHAEHMGFGYSDVTRRNQFWIVLRWYLKIYRYPQWQESIDVTTWPRKPERLFALRDYTINDVEGRRLGAATSTWMVLDSTSRRPCKLELIDGLLHLTTDKAALGENASKILPPEDAQFRHSLTTQFTDIDHNGHVNNARYVEWCMNLYPVEFHQKYRVASFQINFVHECRFGETIDLLLKNEGTAHTIVGRKQNDGKEIFISRLHWEEI